MEKIEIKWREELGLVLSQIYGNFKFYGIDFSIILRNGMSAEYEEVWTATLIVNEYSFEEKRIELAVPNYQYEDYKHLKAYIEANISDLLAELGVVPEKKRGHQVVSMMQEVIRQSYRNYPRVIIAGGRDFDDYDYMCRCIDGLLYDKEAIDTPIKVVSGMDKGAATLGIRYADEHEFATILFPANWKEHPSIAGFLRNEDMLMVATHLIAFWDGKSHDTQHIIEIAHTKGIPVYVFDAGML